MEEDEWELDYVSEGEGHSFVILLRLCLVSSFHFWYSCQRDTSSAETSLGSGSSVSSSTRSMVSEYFRLSEGDS